MASAPPDSNPPAEAPPAPSETAVEFQLRALRNELAKVNERWQTLLAQVAETQRELPAANARILAALEKLQRQQAAGKK